MALNDNLYDMLFPDSDDDSEDIGRLRINDIFNNTNNDEISRYFDLNLYNESFPDNDASTLNVIHFNIRNLSTNKDELETIISMMKRTPDVICLSETWLDSTSESLIKLDGYIGYNVIRDAPHGGVSVFVRDFIKSNFEPAFSFASAEVEICTVSISISNTNYTVSSIYRPRFKHDNIKEFRKVMEPILRNKLFKKSNTILMGDFNINLLEHHTHADTNDFLIFMQNQFYLPVITRATRFPEGLQRGTPSLLDHIFINFSPPAVSGILNIKITDHLPVFLVIVLPVRKFQNYCVRFRVFKKASRDNFTRDLAMIIWEDILISDDLNTNYDAFHMKIYQLYNKHFPIVTKTISHKQASHPWVTPYLISAINNKNISYKNYKLGHLSWEEYKVIRNSTQSIIKASKRSYYINLFNNFKSNTKKLWESLNKLTKASCPNRSTTSIILNNSILTKSKDIANTFNTFFAEIASNLDSKLPKAQTDPLQYLQGNFPNSMTVPEITLLDVAKIIKTLKSKKCGTEDFAPFIIKENSHLLAQPLAFLFNQSISSGKFPDTLKAARIIPLHKKGPKTDINNYRPISLLNIFSKIFEKIMKTHLVSFLERNSVLSKTQFGFQAGKSTLDALIKFSTEVYSQLDCSEFLLSIFVDFSKAFDTVPHELLLKKLDFYGIRGLINDWFADYLSGRTQITIIEGKNSQSAQVTLGVPQGSVLGPILFLLFVNDLPNFSDVLTSILFADDANMYLKGKDPQQLIITANSELFKLYLWCIANRFSINALKTVFILFGNVAPTSLPPLVIKSGFSYETIQRVDKTKFLGVLYDNKMSFKFHVDGLVQRISRTSALIYQLKELLPSYVLKTIYHAHVGSQLNYCNIIWSGAYMTTLMPLIRLLKRIIRNITHSDFLAHTAPLFQEAKILDFSNLRRLCLAVYFLKYQVYNDNKLNRNHNYYTRHKDNLRLPDHRSRLFRHSFICESVEVWNDLTHSPLIDIDSINTLHTFRARVKKYLLSNF